MKRLLLRVFLFIGSFYLIITPFWGARPCEEKWKGKSFNQLSQLSSSEKIEYDRCIKERNEHLEFVRDLGMPALLASFLIAAFGPKVISVLFRKSKN